MFNRILIANRGEIAVRIIRACREMGIETVAIYSTMDQDALHVQMADEAVCVGPPKGKDSYLNMENIISATILTGAQAIHPGFGFLSENSKFAEMCEQCNIVFIGPDAHMIDLMGNKSKARETMLKAGVPVVPGSSGAVGDLEEALKIAEKIGYPVMIKASAGGGGKGMRLAYTKEEFIKAFNTAKSEAKASFGDDTMYIEKFIENPRHIEFQILGDSFGNVVHLGERDCSIQRRHQKVIEEAPSIALSPELRGRMGRDAVLAAKSIGYKNAGTIEFLLDKNGNYYFIEMNTRIQVEHPVTEMITGIDIVKEQIRIAGGLPLSFTQEDISIRGHAIECRINAESPGKGFMPSPGTVKGLHFPGGFGIRVESALYEGYRVPPTYDSMIAKLIAHGKDREEAITKMKCALGEFIIEGMDTNIDFLFQILHTEDFEKGNIDTSFIEKHFSLGRA
ncbi:acetyl-CoA carboxylase biotin carboxylase subunit [Defluviitalea raffinosedens]|uniref:acetyl-CoA carboxylase biotin carboxylase subunit n=1 Tax=Defluviitalea raffinosedens TaxID=1450156 RepID=UPI00195AC074|nr:acetyl-CoA carboxylase biotin carboxylase subunit [Defluviitalea raffinosedens]MBM7685047.1 acetyl-CoA carboxylase biotin carboxylase subunit [Defluviitalea raffinosedens]